MWAAAEDGLTLIAASIPTLRPVLRAIFPTSTVGRSGYSDMEGHQLKPSSHGPARIFSGKDVSRNVARVHAGSSDNMSDRTILGKDESGSWDFDSIKKTTEVTVSGHAR